jgi:methylated-DNA-[protein]-cysteine S-methyltransferase
MVNGTRWSMLESPIGDLILTGHGGALTGLYVGRLPGSDALAEGDRDDRAFESVRGQLTGYFAGERRSFDVPLDLRGTEFQRTVWDALLRVPFGETTTYGEIARRIGRPAAVRAVGAANGRNPVSIIVPCHRVVGSNGALVGYGWGVERKAFLLDHERLVSGATLL